MTYTIWLTDACNMNCTYCYEKYKKIRNLNREVAQNIIEYIFQTNHEKELMILFHGGEPLLNYDLLVFMAEKITERAKEVGCTVKYLMTTNGTLLSDNILDFLEKQNIYLSISCDGSEYTHNRNRKYKSGEGTHANVVKNIRKVLQRFPDLRIRMTFRSSDVHNLFSDIKFLIELGIKYIVPAYDFYDNGWNNTTLEILEQQLRLTKQYLKETKNVYVGLLDQSQYRIKGRCSGGYREINIDTNGDIYPCTLTVGNKSFCIGNIVEGIHDDLRKKITSYSDIEIDECTGCKLNKVCDVPRCRIINYLQTGDYCKIPEISCAVEKIKYQINFGG